MGITIRGLLLGLVILVAALLFVGGLSSILESLAQHDPPAAET